MPIDLAVPGAGLPPQDAQGGSSALDLATPSPKDGFSWEKITRCLALHAEDFLHFWEEFRATVHRWLEEGFHEGIPPLIDWIPQ
jgi:hypothetical protein